MAELVEVDKAELDEMIRQLLQYKQDEQQLRDAVTILEQDFSLVTVIKSMEGKGTMGVIASLAPLMKKMSSNKDSKAFSLLGNVLSKYAK